jgi:hypothetical protein
MDYGSRLADVKIRDKQSKLQILLTNNITMSFFTRENPSKDYVVSVPQYPFVVQVIHDLYYLLVPPSKTTLPLLFLTKPVGIQTKNTIKINKLINSPTPFEHHSVPPLINNRQMDK